MMENTGFNQVKYSNFTPDVTSKHNKNVIGALILTALAVTAGILIYNLVDQKLKEDQKR